jgi:hypothetical protein
MENNQFRNEYFADLTKAFVESNIPLDKLDKHSLREFFKKYMKRDISTTQNLRQNYVTKIYENVISKIREVLGDNSIYLIVDETTDKRNRYVVNVLVGALNGNQSKPMLISTTFVDQTINNNKTVSQCLKDSLRMIWPKNTHYDRVWLVVSDRASYMLKSMNGFKEFFPNLHHITRIVHALHRVFLKISEDNTEINSLIALFKKIIIKSPLREYQFKQKTGLCLPPKPVVTRWGSWLKAAFYYAENYIKIKDFINDLPNSSEAMKSAKNLITSNTLKDSLLHIRDKNHLIKAIEDLQTQSLKVTKQMEILKSVEQKLSGNSLEKLRKSLTKNPDLKKLTENTDYDFKFDTRYAPLVSIEVERSFSKYKEILSYTQNYRTHEYYMF